MTSAEHWKPEDKGMMSPKFQSRTLYVAKQATHYKEDEKHFKLKVLNFISHISFPRKVLKYDLHQNEKIN